MRGERERKARGAEKLDRRKFLGSAAATAGILFIKPGMVRGTAANSAIRVGCLDVEGAGPKMQAISSIQAERE